MRESQFNGSNFSGSCAFSLKQRCEIPVTQSVLRCCVCPEQNFEVKADDLEQICELGRGAYGVVDKMKHVPSGLIMAVKVGEGSINRLPHIQDNILDALIDKPVPFSRYLPRIVFWFGLF